jgi:hypothetical protein
MTRNRYTISSAKASFVAGAGFEPEALSHSHYDSSDPQTESQLRGGKERQGRSEFRLKIATFGDGR